MKIDRQPDILLFLKMNKLIFLHTQKLDLEGSKNFQFVPFPYHVPKSVQKSLNHNGLIMDISSLPRAFLCNEISRLVLAGHENLVQHSDWSYFLIFIV